MAFIGMEWIVVIVAIVLFLFGAKKIPEFARSMGKARGEFTKGQRMVEMEMQRAEQEARFDPAPGTRPDEAGPTTEAVGDSPIRQAATELGIETAGRSDQELKELIRRRVTGD